MNGELDGLASTFNKQVRWLFKTIIGDTDFYIPYLPANGL